jgi:hypothetical protein
LKKAIIICGGNIPAAQSMAANLAASGYGKSDILSFSERGRILENAPHIGGVYILDRKKVKAPVFSGENGNYGEAAVREMLEPVSIKYDAAFNAGTGRIKAAIHSFIRAEFKAGLSLEGGAFSYKGPWYFLEKLKKGAVYSSGFYNDVSFYNSLLIGAVDSITDFQPAVTRPEALNEKAVFAPVNKFFTPGLAEKCAEIMRGKMVEPLVLNSVAEEAFRHAAGGGAKYFVTDSFAAAAAASAAGSNTVCLCRDAGSLAAGPFGGNAVTVSGRPGAGFITDACFAAGKSSLRAAMKKRGAAALKEWPDAGKANPFYIMENEISGYFEKYSGANAGKADIYAEALKASDRASGAFVLYKNLFPVKVMREESAGGNRP